ncbi:5-oxoprolinase subunit C family protein [Deferrisoma camini]|uniref:5-oxoprolinase subunit C family protein n=1 Tax=Deferrisoma camini TaxID=1035120 RepID=UPI0004B89A74|nr:biotin-dependent carboxyltransferase family protein [Deferrisoma camini]
MKTRPILRIRRPGPLTTVQDHGRWGFQHLGVPVSGAMDPLSFRVANALVGNHWTAAVLEITLGGFEAEFLGPTAAALAGGDLGFELDGTPLGPGTSFRAEAGSVLRTKGRPRGCRAYLAVAGGFAVPEVLGSRSTYLPARLGGLEGRALRQGDELRAYGPPFPPGWGPGRRAPPELLSPLPPPGEPIRLRVVLGPQADRFTRSGLHTFLAERFEVSPQADRMGYRLEGPRIEHAGPADILSDGIAWGAVQVPAHGRPIVLMADRQTAGGYPKIATVVRTDIPALAQAVPGDPVTFEAVSLWEAREQLAWQALRLRRWAEGSWEAGGL